MATPTLLNLPPPPSDPVTPSDIPGTPNSTTTSLSALSTTAIKDGHQGSTHHPHHHPHHSHTSSTASTSSTNTLDAERADRISRLAGLERVATLRGTTSAHLHAPSNIPQSQLPQQQPQSTQPGYFDTTTTAPHPTIKERSTVGSASATGSVGGRTTWASGSASDMYDVDPDKMSEDPVDDNSSVGGLSDEGNASLVGFGEGANSTVSGPVSSRGRGVKAREGSPMQGIMGERASGGDGMRYNHARTKEFVEGTRGGQVFEER